MHLAEIAQIVLPTNWAMCEVLRYGMALVAYPHGYPHTINNSCGHQELGCRCTASLSTVPSWCFMRMTVKDLSAKGVPVLMSIFVLWSEQLRAHRLKTKPGVSCCS